MSTRLIQFIMSMWYFIQKRIFLLIILLTVIVGLVRDSHSLPRFLFNANDSSRYLQRETDQQVSIDMPKELEGKGNTQPGCR